MEIDICQILHERIYRMEKMYLVDIDRATHKYNVIPYKGAQTVKTEHDHAANELVGDIHITLSDRKVHGDGVHSGVFKPSNVVSEHSVHKHTERLHPFSRNKMLQLFIDSSPKEKLAILIKTGYNPKNPLDNSWLDNSDIANEMWKIYNKISGVSKVFQGLDHQGKLQFLADMGYKPEFQNDPAKLKLWIQNSPNPSMYEAMLEMYIQAAGAAAPVAP
jgi:hypothetical protein